MFEYILDLLQEHERQAVCASLAVLAGVKYFDRVAESHIQQLTTAVNSDEDEHALAKEIVETRRKIALLKELHDLGDQLRKK